MSKALQINKSESGVTIIELLMVVLVMAVVASISLPSFMSIGRGSGVQGAVNNVAATLSLTRQRAISHRDALTFVYGLTDEGGYYFKVVDSEEKLIQPTNMLPSGVAFLKMTGSSPNYTDVQLNQPEEARITFRTDGSLDSGPASHNIRIREVRGGTFGDISRHIAVYGLTGMVKIIGD